MLDTPPGHPILPLFAQKFFSYYLSRPLPSTDGSESNGVGHKFFEGLVNSMYFNKIKAKMLSCSAHHHLVLMDRKADPLNLEALYETFHLWLDDPVVLEFTLHIPSLGPQYQPAKLTSLLTESKELWLDTVDYDSVIESNNKCISEWDRLHFRQINLKNETEHRKVDNLPPGARIIKRLKSYDCPVPPPILILTKSSVIPVNDNMLVDEGSLLNAISPAINNLTDYARKFHENSMEYGSLMCAYMEFIPALYENAETEILRKVSCPGTTGPKKEKFDCSGTAPILLKFKEARKDESVNHKIIRNRENFQALTQRMIQVLPIIASSSIVFLDNMIKTILRMYGRYLGRGSHNADGQRHYHRIGISLFYHLTDLLSEDVPTCPPLRHMLSTFLETLGQSLVADQPDECLRLLERIVERPILSQFLTPSFTPNVADTPTFLRMYEIINSNVPKSDSMLAFVLLSKMSMEDWLERCSPGLTDRSKLISMIGISLRDSGINPSPDRLMVHGLVRNHLLTLVLTEFPAHYEEVVKMLLQLSEDQTLDPEVWLDLLNLLISKQEERQQKVGIKDTPEKWKSVFSEFAHHQTFLHREEIFTCARLMAVHFRKERFEVGLHGLYTKYHKYAGPLALYFSLQGHLCITSWISHDSGSPPDQLVLKIWEEIMGLFHPWLVPLIGSDRRETAAWIQQLAETQQVLFPWAPGDAQWATLMAKSFAQVVEFLNDLVPSRRTAVALTWSEFYVKKFAHTSVKDYVLTVIHNSLLPLPWSGFYPEQRDLDLMVKVIDTFLPPSHAFIGRIFVEIPWTNVLKSQPDSGNAMIPALLKLIVKLAAEPQIRQIGRLLTLLHEAENFPWWKVDENTFESLMQWYVMSVDCKVMLNHNQRHPLDAAVLRLLELATGDPESVSTVSSRAKRQIFVKCCVRLLLSTGSKHKNFLGSHRSELKSTLKKMIEDIEIVNIKTVSPNQRLEEVRPLVRDYLSLLNCSLSSPLPGAALEVLLRWIDGHTAQSPIVMAILELLGPTVTTPVAFARVTEASMEAYFFKDDDDSNNSQRSSWEEALSIFKFPLGNNKIIQEILDTSVKEGHLLVLTAHLRIRRPLCLSIRDERVLLSSLLDWFRHLQISEKNEAKLPLLYMEYLYLTNRQYQFDTPEDVVVKFILDFLEILVPLTSESGAVRNLLGAIGFSSQYKLTPRAKFLALSLMVFLFTQITVDNKIRKISDIMEEMGSKDNTDESEEIIREKPELGSARLQLYSMKQNKAYVGLVELIDWVLNMTSEKSNQLDSVQDFIAYLVVDNLYVERYLKY